MSNKLVITALVALSVTKLTAHLAETQYELSELAEAITLEKAKTEPRSTAIAALEEAMAPKEEEAESFTVPKGKSILTLAGIKVGGDEITAKMVTGGADKLALLKEKGLLV